MSDLQPSLTDTNAFAARAERLAAHMHACIPLTRHMQVRVTVFDATGLMLTAPLAPNINHQYTAFGGSLASLATLACWGLIWLLLEDVADMHIVVSDSHMSYLRPVTDALVARCGMPDAHRLKKFFAMLKRHNKARLQLEARIAQGEALCARYAGTFVAFRRNP